MRPRTASASACSILPFSTARASCFSILPRPLSSVVLVDLAHHDVVARPGPPPGRSRGPSGRSPSTPTFLISTSLPPVSSRSSAGSLYVTGRSRGSRRVRHLVLQRAEKRNAFNGELIQALGRAHRGRGRRRRRARAWSCAATGPMFSSGMDLNDLRELVGEPGRPARASGGRSSPGGTCSRRCRSPRSARSTALPGRGVRAGARLRLPRDGRGRDGRDHGGAGRAAARRGRLLAAAGDRRPRQRQGADHDRQGDRRPRGAPDRLRQPDRAGRGARRRDRGASPTSCWPARPRRSAWPSG